VKTETQNLLIHVYIRDCFVGQADVVEAYKPRSWLRRTKCKLAWLRWTVEWFFFTYSITFTNFLLFIIIQIYTADRFYTLVPIILFIVLLHNYVILSSFFSVSLSLLLTRLSKFLDISCKHTYSASPFNFCTCRNRLGCCFPIMLFSLKFKPSTALLVQCRCLFIYIPHINGNVLVLHQLLDIVNEK